MIEIDEDYFEKTMQAEKVSTSLPMSKMASHSGLASNTHNGAFIGVGGTFQHSQIRHGTEL